MPVVVVVDIRVVGEWLAVVLFVIEAEEATDKIEPNPGAPSNMPVVVVVDIRVVGKGLAAV